MRTCSGTGGNGTEKFAQESAEPPGLHGFPTYFSLNLFLEKRFQLFGKYWAMRVGFNNIAGNKNPLYVNNDSDETRPKTY